MVKKRLPGTLYVRWEWPHVSTEEPWLTAEPTLEAVMDSDGPEMVGVYRLVEVKRAEKVLKVHGEKRDA